METVSINFDISTTDATADLGVRVKLDSNTVYENSHVTQNIAFAHDVSDDDGEHVLEIELFGKKPEHTKINEAGEIVQDAMLRIGNITIDSIDLTTIIMDNSKYCHDFNGTKDPVEEPFYGNMGCNGVFKLQFTTPIYLWLLENM